VSAVEIRQNVRVGCHYFVAPCSERRKPAASCNGSPSLWNPTSSLVERVLSRVRVDRRPLLEAGFAKDVPADLGARVVGRQRPRALALVAVAAGRIDGAFEVALLADDLRVP